MFSLDMQGLHAQNATMSSDTRKGRPSMKKYLAVLAVGAVLFTACGTGATDEQVNVAESTIEADTNLELLRAVWDLQTPADQASICDFYNTPPVGTTPQMVRLFARGAELGYAEANRILNIVLAEEC